MADRTGTPTPDPLLERAQRWLRCYAFGAYRNDYQGLARLLADVRAEALEEAAKVADAYLDPLDDNADICGRIANRILALNDRPTTDVRVAGDCPHGFTRPCSLCVARVEALREALAICDERAKPDGDSAYEAGAFACADGILQLLGGRQASDGPKEEKREP